MTTDIPRYPYVHVQVPADQAELVSDELWTLGAQGVEERDGTTLVRQEEGVLLVASFADDGDAHHAVAALRHPARIEYVVGDEWREAWRTYFEPTEIGERLLLRPSWREAPTGERVILTIDPGGAFGSGIHETTRLVLGVIDNLVKGGEQVLDVGCGSGILSIAALLLGAQSAIGIDVDAMAVDVSRENASINGVADRFRASTRDIREIPGTFDLVVANIQAPILIEMADALTQRVGSGGALVLSGILADQADEVTGAFCALRHKATPAENEWRAIVLTR